MPDIPPPAEHNAASSCHLADSAVSPRLTWPIAVAAGITLATIGVLRWKGRLWWGACGGKELWISAVQSSHCSQHLIDPYCFTHLLHGVALCGILAWVWRRLPTAWSLCVTLFVEAVWEILENSPLVIDRYRTATIALGYEGDSIVNSLGDLLCCGLGYLLARRVGWRWSVAMFVVTEVILAVMIRDNLSLNILMLVYPIEAVKTWQAGP
ncbi:MAG: DUF2585 family protein [Planctomycetes bacterium]|nr:DUF2585 family protein [Planctomycetota bacterium]